LPHTPVTALHYYLPHTCFQRAQRLLLLYAGADATGRAAVGQETAYAGHHVLGANLAAGRMVRGKN